MAAGMQRLAGLFRLDDEGWRRHANPWSAWTRVPLLPVAVVAILMREPLGPWLWAVLAALVGWALVNPRAFPPPPHFRAWASRAVLGERLWIRDGPPDAATGRRILFLTIAQIACLTPLIAGLWHGRADLALGTTALVLAGKFAFLQIMVGLQDAAVRRGAADIGAERG